MKKGRWCLFFCFILVSFPSPSFGKKSDPDRDGIRAPFDKCPYRYGKKKMEGCPDLDGDGIHFGLDKCPAKPGVKSSGKYNGCPDKDGDGVPDHLDFCPQKKGNELDHGCQTVMGRDGKPNRYDRDKDGVNDVYDKCPNHPGTDKTPRQRGCPGHVDHKVKSIFVYMRGFARRSASIPKSAAANLKGIANHLKRNSNQMAQIVGFTASEYKSRRRSKRLATSRARRVVRALFLLGVNIEQLGEISGRPGSPGVRVVARHTHQPLPPYRMIGFVKRSTKLSVVHKQKLKALIYYLNRNSKYRVHLMGYADRREYKSWRRRRRLSWSRTRRVAKALRLLGVDVRQLGKRKGFGSRYQLLSSKTEAERRINRRVELVVPALYPRPSSK